VTEDTASTVRPLTDTVLPGELDERIAVFVADWQRIMNRPLPGSVPAQFEAYRDELRLLSRAYVLFTAVRSAGRRLAYGLPVDGDALGLDTIEEEIPLPARVPGTHASPAAGIQPFADPARGIAGAYDAFAAGGPAQ
jgi:hypothetical protein